MKRLFFVVAICSLAFASNAQVKFGVKAGANFYKFSGSDTDFEDESPDMKVGIAGGGMVNIPINEMFSVQPELLYSMEGAKYSISGVDLKFNVNFINVPILIQYNSSGFYAETGPQIGFLTSAKVKVEDEEEDYKEFFKSTAFSWAIGLGYRLPSGIGFGARYNLGLSSLADDDDDDTDIKSSGFHIGISYLFGGKKK